MILWTSEALGITGEQEGLTMRLATWSVGVGKTRGILATRAVMGRRCTELARRRHAIIGEAPHQTQVCTIKARSK